MGATSTRISPTSKKHLGNSGGFILAPPVLVLLAGAHVISATITITPAASLRILKYKAAAFFDDADVSLHDYLFNGDRRSQDRLQRSREHLRELCAGDDELEEWSNWEERWYNDFAQPLIQERQKVD